jgi:hypothetical protein
MNPLASTIQLMNFKNLFLMDCVESLPTIRDRRGQISHAEGHPNWHPIAFLHSEGLTLVIEGGRKFESVPEITGRGSSRKQGVLLID